MAHDTLSYLASLGSGGTPASLQGLFDLVATLYPNPSIKVPTSDEEQ